jgi:GNAT superfamily N-acetyltransferase
MVEADTKTEICVRHALADEADLLSRLALRSKSHWGYDADFLEACRAELTLSPHYIAASPVYVLEEGKRIVGFYGLSEQGGELELLYLFVEPAAVKRGYGKRLWDHAIELAARLGFEKLSIESDPFAEDFYRAMGAERVGEVTSSIKPDRKLPLLKFHLA